MSCEDWSESHAVAFDHAWSALNCTRLLAPSKLQWLTDEDVELTINTALKDLPLYEGDEDLEASLRQWLSQERDQAILTQQSNGAISL